VSFLEPEPLPRRQKLLMGGIVVMSLLAAADAFKIIDLHGFAIPLLMSMSVVVTVSQRWERQEEEEDLNG
jgi:hypothetical protein